MILILKHSKLEGYNRVVERFGRGLARVLILRLPHRRWSLPLVKEEEDDGMRWRVSRCPSLGCLALDAEQRSRME
jgi:hypothetical protein